ncbi:MAG: hypothetical protein JW863_03200 [Chitinispirillaceae bacterium]|nr:hypothetical protein [Chitinispirillaceae bacterium]
MPIMEKIDFALLCDGTSDRCLVPILKWLLRRYFADIPINGIWADVSRSRLEQYTLVNRIRLAADLYEPDVLFIHRDAEAQDQESRYEEIRDAVSRIRERLPRLICVVPVRMTESWLLFNERAMKVAAGNPNCRTHIELPPLSTIESLPDPKQRLIDILIIASELRGRHLKRFKPLQCRHLITENIEDFSPLFELEAFQRLSRDIEQLSMTAQR